MIEITFIIRCEYCSASIAFRTKKISLRRWARESARVAGWTNTKPAGKGQKLIDICPACQRGSGSNG